MVHYMLLSTCAVVRYDSTCTVAVMLTNLADHAQPPAFQHPLASRGDGHAQQHSQPLLDLRHNLLRSF